MCVLGWGFFVEVSEDLKQTTTFCKGIAAKQMLLNIYEFVHGAGCSLHQYPLLSEIIWNPAWHPFLPLQIIMTNLWCVFYHFRKNLPTRRFKRRQLRWTRSFVLQRILFGHLRICYDTSHVLCVFVGNPMMGLKIDIFAALCLRMPKVLHGFRSFSWGGWCDQLRVVIFSANSQIADITSFITLRRCSTNVAS